MPTRFPCKRRYSARNRAKKEPATYVMKKHTQPEYIY